MIKAIAVSSSTLVFMFWFVVWYFKVRKHRGLGLTHYIYFILIPVLFYSVHKYILLDYSDDEFTILKENLVKLVFNSKTLLIISIILIAFIGFYLGFRKSRAWNQNKFRNLFSLPVLLLIFQIIVYASGITALADKYFYPSYILSFLLWFFPGVFMLLDVLLASVDKMLNTREQ